MNYLVSPRCICPRTKHIDFFLPLKNRAKKKRPLRTNSFSPSQQQQHYGTWLQSFDWSHWATLTTSYELTLKSARRIATGLYKELSRAGDTKIFWAAEPFDLKEGYHLHALIKIPDVLTYKNIIQTYQHVSGNKTMYQTPSELKNCEKFYSSNNESIKSYHLLNGEVVSTQKRGWNRIQLENYDPSKGASHYIGKYITKQLSDYDILTNSNSRKY